MHSLFSCPNCGARLVRETGTLACPAGHRFDLAREGYVHLLPANRKHSADPGDDREMVRARTAFLDGGWYAPLQAELCAETADCLAAVLRREAAGDPAPVVLDAGCGEGYYTAALAKTAAAFHAHVCGVDLSKSAVKKAARRCPAAEIAVASVYRLPLADRSVAVLVNCFSPLAVEEFARVLAPGGQFLYVVPGPRHLWELKQLLYDRPYENEEKQAQYPGFDWLGAKKVETRFTLPTAEAVQALFHMTPYTWKTPRDGAARLATVTELTVTAQFAIHRFCRTQGNADF